MLTSFIILALCGSAVASTSTLFYGGTIVVFDEGSESINVIRNGSLLVTDDRIVAVSTALIPLDAHHEAEKVDVSGQIVMLGFIDTHRHGWQIAFKTLGSNTTLAEYIQRYYGPVLASHFRPEDVYLGQLMGLYEALNGGVTTTLDHAHHTWSNKTAYSGLNASVDSGARVF